MSDTEQDVCLILLSSERPSLTLNETVQDHVLSFVHIDELLSVFLPFSFLLLLSSASRLTTSLFLARSHVSFPSPPFICLSEAEAD